MIAGNNKKIRKIIEGLEEQIDKITTRSNRTSGMETKGQLGTTWARSTLGRSGSPG
jgi:hypothetical protein